MSNTRSIARRAFYNECKINPVDEARIEVLMESCTGKFIHQYLCPGCSFLSFATIKSPEHDDEYVLFKGAHVFGPTRVSVNGDLCLEGTYLDGSFAFRSTPIIEARGCFGILPSDSGDGTKIAGFYIKTYSGRRYWIALGEEEEFMW